MESSLNYTFVNYFTNKLYIIYFKNVEEQNKKKWDDYPTPLVSIHPETYFQMFFTPFWSADQGRFFY